MDWWKVNAHMHGIVIFTLIVLSYNEYDACDRVKRWVEKEKEEGDEFKEEAKLVTGYSAYPLEDPELVYHRKVRHTAERRHCRE